MPLGAIGTARLIAVHLVGGAGEEGFGLSYVLTHSLHDVRRIRLEVVIGHQLAKQVERPLALPLAGGGRERLAENGGDPIDDCPPLPIVIEVDSPRHLIVLVAHISPLST